MQKTIIKIPTVHENERIGSSFNHLFRVVDATNHTSEPVWDFANVSFLHPFFLAPLAIFRNQSKKHIECINIPFNVQSYLNNIFFDRLLHFENVSRQQADEVMEKYSKKCYTPICSFEMSDANKDVFGSIVRNIIVRQANLDTKINNAISYFLGELIDNIYEHSHSDKGFLFSQYLEKENDIYLVIADSGITIYNSFLNAGLFQEEIDQDEIMALRLANEGRSTKNRPNAENRGYGISTSKRMLVEGLGGGFFMQSGGAFHRYEKNSYNQYVNVRNFLHWDGTVILMRIPITAPQGFNYIDFLE